QNITVAHEFITDRELVFRNLCDDVRSGTVIDHFRFRPDVRVCSRLVVAGNSRDGFGSLLTTSRYGALTVGANLYVIARPKVVLCLAIAALAGWLHYQFVELGFERGQFDTILRP